MREFVLVVVCCQVGTTTGFLTLSSSIVSEGLGKMIGESFVPICSEDDTIFEMDPSSMSGIASSLSDNFFVAGTRLTGLLSEPLLLFLDKTSLDAGFTKEDEDTVLIS